MKLQTRLGVVLLIIGVLIFSYEGITAIRQRQVAELSTPNVTNDKPDDFPVLQAIGTLGTAGGLFLVVLGSRRS